jgi:hypothetical protein
VSALAPRMDTARHAANRDAAKRAILYQVHDRRRGRSSNGSLRATTGMIGFIITPWGRKCSLLLRNRSPGSVHERLHLLQGDDAIFVGIHCLEDSFVSRLKLLQ